MQNLSNQNQLVSDAISLNNLSYSIAAGAAGGLSHHEKVFKIRDGMAPVEIAPPVVERRPKPVVKVQPVDPEATPFELHGVISNVVPITKEPVEIVTWQMSTQTEDVQIIDHET